MKKFLLYINIALIALLAACSLDDADGGAGEGKMTTVTMTIGTRATGTPEDPAYDIELIHDWWVAFVDKDGIVRAVVERPGGTGSGYVEEEKIEVDVPTGTYTLYAFANLTQKQLSTADPSLVFTVGSAYPSGIETAQWQLLQHWSNTADIPMSGKQSVTVTGRANEVFSIEVVRMLAKIDLQFSNESSRNVTINYVKMSQSQSDNIPLLPNYTYLDSGWPVDANSDGPNLVSGITIDNSAGVSGVANSISYSESHKDHDDAHSHKITEEGPNYWMVTLHNHNQGVGTNYYNRIMWKLGLSINSADTYRISMQLMSEDCDIPNVDVGLNWGAGDPNSNVQSTALSRQNLTQGVWRTVSFTVTGLTQANVWLQVSAGACNHENARLRMKDVSITKVLPMPSVRTYTRDYTDASIYPAVFTANTLAAYTGTPAAAWTDRFYVRESQANYNIAQRYLMTVNITREGSGHPEDLLFALTKDLKSIYRNDHIVLPLIISDYMVSLDVNFYPPILGYPAVITRESEEEFLCEFATQGTFEILPKVVDSYNGYVLVYNTGNPYFTYSIEHVEDPDHIFSVTPAIELLTGETIGELNTNEGVAYVDIQVTVHRTGLLAEQVYDRRIYIIRKK